jgi:hypothetical protein
MKSMLLAVGVLMAAPFAHAQQTSRTPDPADPNVEVPPPVYESALTGYTRAPKDSAVTPDKTWRQVNDALATEPAAHQHHQAKARQ